METERIIKIAIFALAAVIVISFLLPWAHVESKQVGTFTKVLTGQRQKNVASISGLQIPLMANGDGARLISSIAKIFNPSIENINIKSFLVIFIPLLALAMAACNYLYEKHPWANLAIAIIGILIFLVAVIKLATTDLDKMVLQIKIGLGMWAILISYLAIGVLATIRFIRLHKAQQPKAPAEPAQ